jgi:hypothetical protein
MLCLTLPDRPRIASRQKVTADLSLFISKELKEIDLTKRQTIIGLWQSLRASVRTLSKFLKKVQAQ